MCALGMASLEVLPWPQPLSLRSVLGDTDQQNSWEAVVCRDCRLWVGRTPQGLGLITALLGDHMRVTICPSAI